MDEENGLPNDGKFRHRSDRRRESKCRKPMKRLLSGWTSPTHLDVIGSFQKQQPEMEVFPLPVLWNSVSAARQITEFQAFDRFQ